MCLRGGGPGITRTVRSYWHPGWLPGCCCNNARCALVLLSQCLGKLSCAQHIWHAVEACCVCDRQHCLCQSLDACVASGGSGRLSSAFGDAQSCTWLAVPVPPGVCCGCQSSGRSRNAAHAHKPLHSTACGMRDIYQAITACAGTKQYMYSSNTIAVKHWGSCQFVRTTHCIVWHTMHEWVDVLEGLELDVAKFKLIWQVEHFTGPRLIGRQHVSGDGDDNDGFGLLADTAHMSCEHACHWGTLCAEVHFVRQLHLPGRHGATVVGDHNTMTAITAA